MFSLMRPGLWRRADPFAVVEDSFKNELLTEAILSVEFENQSFGDADVVEDVSGQTLTAQNAFIAFDPDCEDGTLAFLQVSEGEESAWAWA